MFCSLGGQRIVELQVLIGYYGTPVIYAMADEPAPSIGSAATQLLVADLSMTCTVFRTSPFAGKQPFLLVGGYGGWDNPIPAQAYSIPGGSVTSDLVLGDCAKACGEQIVVAAPALLGPNYFREAAPASRTLKSLAGAIWYVDTNGVTQVGPRTNAAPISSAFQIVNYEGGRGVMTIATEHPADWMPARTFTAPTLPGSYTVTSTELHFDKSGALRLEVLVA